jgi:hypothetical protein
MPIASTAERETGRIKMNLSSNTSPQGVGALAAILLGLLSYNSAQAQILSNYPADQSSGYAIIQEPSFATQWLAQEFTFSSGVPSYTLTSVTMDISAFTNFSSEFPFALYSNSGTNTPGSLLSTLTLTLSTPAAFADSTDTFTPDSAVTLSANSSYWVVGRTTADGTDSISWQRTSVTNPAGTGITGASFGPGLSSHDLGSSWGGIGNELSLQVNGQLSVAPEPSTWAMLLGGLGLLAFGRARRRRSAV